MNNSDSHPQRMSSGCRVLLMCTICIVALPVLFAGLVYAIQTANYERLRRQGDSLIAEIEAYKAAAGTYPEDLKAANIDLPESRYGQWHYRQLSGPLFANGSFVVSISTKQQYSIWSPYMTMSKWGPSHTWRISTDAC